ncbi:MAG: hypothetical protein WBA23_20365 [Tunicatimonas sp.]|uniref:hypothetical protein n=1 Tax=Tunicatimonas sp. TaxID=1940096 RepID=UPI003C73F8E1
METLSISRPNDLPTAAINQPPTATTSLRQSGLHTLRFPALAPITVADRMGYRNELLEKIIGEQDRVEGVRRFQQPLVDYDYDLKDNHIEAVYEYPLPYQLYPIYVPYQQLEQAYPQLTKLLITFFKIARNLGVSFWFESYYSDSLIRMLSDDEEAYFEPEVSKQGQKFAQDAQAIQQAYQKARIKRPGTLKKKLLGLQNGAESESRLIATLLRWVEFLDEKDTLANYTGQGGTDDEVYEDRILPTDRYIVLPAWGELGEQWWHESLQHGDFLPIHIRVRLDENLHVPAIPTFPMRLSTMMIDIFEALEALIPPDHDE